MADYGDGHGMASGFERLAQLGILKRPGDTAREAAEDARDGDRIYYHIPPKRPLHGEILPPGRQDVARPAHVAPAVIDPMDLIGIEPPEPQWIVPGWLPVGTTTLLYGEPGTGKTLLAQQLLTSCATGSPWLGLPVERCAVFASYCEDDAGIIHHRQARINARLGSDMRRISDNMRWVCPVGQDNVLLRFGRDGSPILTDRYRWLRDEILGFGARVALIDTVGHAFGGNENDRGQVTAFLGVALTALAQQMGDGAGGSLLITGHPSKSGVATGSGDSGSMGWVGAARAVWVLQRPSVEVANGRMAPDMRSDNRILTCKKVNSAKAGQQVTARWSDGFFEVPTGEGQAGTALASLNREMEADDLFLRLLAWCDRRGKNLSDSNRSGNFAPKLMAKMCDTEGFGQGELAAAMFRLIRADRLCLQPYGRAGDERRRLALPGAIGEADQQAEDGAK